METAIDKAVDAEIRYSKSVNDVTAGMARGEKAAFDRAHAGETAAKKAEAQAIIDAEKEKQRQEEIGKARVSAQQAYDKSIDITAEKAKAGFITQEEAAKANFDANNRLINDLYNLGYTTDQKTGAVGSARLTKALADYQTQTDAFKAAEDEKLAKLAESLAQEQTLKQQANQAYLDWLKEKDDADKTAAEKKKLYDAAALAMQKDATFYADQYLQGMTEIGKVLSYHDTLQQNIANSIQAVASAFMQELPKLLLQAGLQMMTPLTWPIGLGLIAASGLVALSNSSGFTQSVLTGNPIKKFADGTNSAPGGLSLVGERGPELVNLPTGSKVYNNSQTTSMLSQANSRTFVFNSPAALSPVETRREFERMSRRLAFEGVA